MKNILSLILILFICQNIRAQKYECGWYGKKTVEERKKVFPFNKAKRVLLISYSNKEFQFDKNGQRIKKDSISLVEAQEDNPNIINKYHVKDDIYSGVYFSIEEKELTEKYVEELSNVLVNYKIKKLPRAITSSLSFIPKNAILFFDDNNTIIAFIEICFECKELVMSPEPIDDLNKYAISQCPEILNIVWDIFRKNGIKYGVEDDCLNNALIEDNYFIEHSSLMTGYSLGELPLIIEIDAEKSNKDFVALRISIKDGETKKPLKGASCTEVRVANKGNEKLTIKKLISVSDENGLIFLKRNEKLQLICIDCPGFVPQVYEYDKIVKCGN